MKKLIAIMALTVLTSSAFGELYIDDVAVGGNGCAQGTYDYVLSPDKTKISVLFDNYIAETDYHGGKKLDRKSCNIAISLNVPAGLQVSWVTLDYRGYVFVPKGARASFTSRYFFAGYQHGDMFRKSWSARRAAKEEDFTLSDAFPAASWSPCGESVILRANTAATVNNRRNPNEEALMQLDSIDAGFNLLFHLRIQACN